MELGVSQLQSLQKHVLIWCLLIHSGPLLFDLLVHIALTEHKNDIQTYTLLIWLLSKIQTS